MLWLFAVLPSLDLAAIKRELLSPAGGLPFVLWALATLGLFWADVSWSERLGGYTPFHRLLVIPLLLAQFRRSEHGMRVLIGFFASVTAVLLLSFLLVLFPGLPWRAGEYGVPVKDYILQSGNFLICAFVLLQLAIDDSRVGRWRSIISYVAFAVLFLANIAFVATGRTALLGRTGAGAVARLAGVSLERSDRRRAAGRGFGRGFIDCVALSERPAENVGRGNARLRKE